MKYCELNLIFLSLFSLKSECISKLIRKFAIDNFVQSLSATVFDCGSSHERWEEMLRWSVVTGVSIYEKGVYPTLSF